MVGARRRIAVVTSIGLLWVTDWMVKDRMRLIMGASVLSGAALCALTQTLDPIPRRFLHGNDRLRDGRIYSDRLGYYPRACAESDGRAGVGTLWDRCHDCCHWGNLGLRMDHGATGP